jgi:hypothetical protein
MSTTTPTSEAEILLRALDPNSAVFSVEFLSRVEFAPVDREQMRELAASARDGTLTDAQRDELRRYEITNDLLAILRSKARLALSQAGGNRA